MKMLKLKRVVFPAFLATLAICSSDAIAGTLPTTVTRGMSAAKGSHRAARRARPAPPVLTATTTTVVPSASSITLGDTVTLAATVAAGAGTPSGVVVFFDGATPLGIGILNGVNGNDQATFSTSLLYASTSPHSITATYRGDASFLASTSAPAIVTVQTRTSSTSVALNPTTVVVGQTSTATITLIDSGSVPPGTADVFATTGAPATGRTGFSAALFGDGLVLVAGGTD